MGDLKPLLSKSFYTGTQGSMVCSDKFFGYPNSIYTVCGPKIDMWPRNMLHISGPHVNFFFANHFLSEQLDLASRNLLFNGDLGKTQKNHQRSAKMELQAYFTSRSNFFLYGLNPAIFFQQFLHKDTL